MTSLAREPLNTLMQPTYDRRLMWHGMFLFLIGLLTGILVQSFTNPRIGLSSHLTALMNGILLIALGAIWTEVRLRAMAKAVAFWLMLFGAYMNWLATALAAAFGSKFPSQSTFINQSKPWQDFLVMNGLFSVTISTLIASILILYGLRKKGALDGPTHPAVGAES